VKLTEHAGHMRQTCDDVKWGSHGGTHKASHLLDGTPCNFVRQVSPSPVHVQF
jgi:hypothetical protein